MNLRPKKSKFRIKSNFVNSTKIDFNKFSLKKSVKKQYYTFALTFNIKWLILMIDF